MVGLVIFRIRGRVVKALHLGCNLFGGLGSNPNGYILFFFSFGHAGVVTSNAFH